MLGDRLSLELRGGKSLELEAVKTERGEEFAARLRELLKAGR